MSDNILNNARGRAIVANYNFWTHADQNLNQINQFTILVTNVGSISTAKLHYRFQNFNYATYRFQK
jgi:hypothetical protein